MAMVGFVVTQGSQVNIQDRDKRACPSRESELGLWKAQHQHINTLTDIDICNSIQPTRHCTSTITFIIRPVRRRRCHLFSGCSLEPVSSPACPVSLDPLSHRHGRGRVDSTDSAMRHFI